jgi:hypothetical protein
MTQMAARVSSIDETRLAAATAAARTERRNRPIHVLMFAVVLLVLAAGLLGWSVLQKVRAAKAYRSQRDQTAEIVNKAGMLRTLMAQAEAQSTPGSGEDKSIHGRLDDFQKWWTDVGLANPQPLPSSTPSDARATNGRVQRRVVYTNIKSDSLEKLMAWMKTAVENIHGLEVRDIRLIPEANQWSLNVTFSRSERQDGT